MFQIRVCLKVFCFTAWVFVCLGQETNKLCAVTFRVVDVSGRPQPYAVKAFTYDAGPDESGRFQGGLRGTVPCRIGMYSYTLERLMGSPRVVAMTKMEGKIGARDPANWLTVTTDPTAIVSPDGRQVGSVNQSGPANYVWTGKVFNGGGRRLWITFRSVVPNLRTEALLESEIDEDGTFRVFRGFRPGDYIVHVTDQNSRILYYSVAKVKRMYPEKTMEITLSSAPPASITVE